MQRGFSLLELAIVLGISGLMVGYVIHSNSRTANAPKADCYVSTNAQLYTIKEAINSFARKNDRLPLPAARNIGTDNTSYGREVTPAQIAASAIDQVGTTSIGALPFQALGLNSTFAGDCWGNKFTYMVTTALTTSNSSGGYLDAAQTGQIAIKSSTTTTFNPNAAFAVISHGEDELGAVKLNYSGVGKGWCAGVDLKHLNCNVAGAAADAVRNNGANAGAAYYDDIMVAANKPQTLSAAAPSTTNLYCWGWNNGTMGQLGDGTTVASRYNPTLTATPADASAPVTYKTFECSSQLGKGTCCALTLAGKAYCWGFNSYGMVGDGTITHKTVPTAVVGAPAFSSVAITNGTACGLTAAGKAYCWGNDAAGTIGDNDATTPKTSATEVQGGLNFMYLKGTKPGSAITTGSLCGLTSTGKVYCWGHNAYGQLGVGDTVNRDVPTEVSGSHAFTKLYSYPLSFCALKANGEVWCWGNNFSGDIGDGTSGAGTDKVVPTQVISIPAMANLNEGFSSGCGLTSAGKAYCWGNNSQGQIGIGNTTNPQATPQPVDTATIDPSIAFTQIHRGFYTTFGLTAGGTMYSWGQNGASGLCGVNTTTANYTKPTLAVAGVSNFTKYYNSSVNSYGTDASGNIWAWGANSNGVLGVGTTGAFITPTPISGGHKFGKLSGSQANMCGLTNAGCDLPWGGVIAHDATVTAYLAASPAGACTSEVQTCSNGTLSGSYQYGSCTPAVNGVCNYSCFTSSGSCNPSNHCNLIGCSSGTISNFDETDPNLVKWKCNGSGGGATVNCSFPNPPAETCPSDPT